MDDVAAALAAENKELRARLRAFKQSRWNRLNPRQLLRPRNGMARPYPPDFEHEVVERGRFCRFTATSESRMGLSNVRKNEFN